MQETAKLSGNHRRHQLGKKLSIMKCITLISVIFLQLLRCSYEI
jgi:hypothetical protein